VARYVPPWEIAEDSLYFQAFNRSKKSICVNIQHPDGKSILHDLVRCSDALYNNLRGDQPAKLGLTYESLREVNPKIVCCSLSGFGLTGPRMSEPGYDYLVQGYAGIMAITGEPDGPPTKCGVSFVDYAGGYLSALGLMVALFDAQRTGVGRDVDVSLLDTAIHLLGYLPIWSLNRPWEPTKLADSAHPTLVPSQNFRTRDGWLVIFCAKEKFFASLVEALDLPELARDPRFKTFADRYRNRHELLPPLKARFLDKTTTAWLDLLRGRVPCAPGKSVREALEDEQVRARGMLWEVDHPTYGRLREVGCPIKVSGDQPVPRPAPTLGEHTSEILTGLLGYPAERVAELRRGAVVR
jgi:crotonobetainyl-CoA:carnitine CoA-transferase CaiB-like acyl-CoA transferase